MSIGHFYDAGAYLEYGEDSVLRPTDDLNATVHTHRDAERYLRKVPGDSVIVVKPTGLASSYALTKRPLTAIDVASLSQEARHQVKTFLETDLAEFEFIQVGRAEIPAQNRSLAEY
jgi:hypothetical protein